MLFFTYPRDRLPSLHDYCMLSFDGPLLSKKDVHLGLFLIDGTWQYADTMMKQTSYSDRIQKRSLPPDIYTAYPRKQTKCHYPERGLASVEALFLAFLLTGRDPEGLLDNYYWKEAFLKQPSIKKWL